MNLGDITGANHEIEIEEGYLLSDSKSISMLGQCYIKVYQYPSDYKY